ncbi:NmrA family transcriptional regulator [Metarhizium acridum CQMa 102]|uniref:NmrA family transcriptional regulator n=1 Tax=Metarhizium acridum (strain CQMa 102) TaxID=655827 RepID=E9EI53_METAQ|nr:NmrA family transcriptional regulator [Metarhizium acridum CQMa 102]EFY84399.1 NmrA family transcriptional regulator [Metarhizium acridum CQMa 102]
MVVVAVAGGTGGVGRTVLDAIAKSGQHQAIVLSRTTSAATAVNKPKHFAVDYESVEQMKQVLQDNNVEVVVSALLLVDEDVAQSQINLIRAAAQSGTVTKFIPSEYYIDFHAPIPGADLFTNFQLEAEAELSRHPQLTWTLIRVGIFLDHLTMPHNPKTTYISPFWVFVDMDHEQCVFPGDGSQPLVLTHSQDLAAYIERLVGLPAENWPRESLVASNKLLVKDLESLVKKVTGRNFKVTYDSVEEIHKGHITPLPSNTAVFQDPAKGELFHDVERQVMLSMLSGAHNLPGRNLAELFPEVQTTNIEDFFRAGWTLKESTAS